MTQLGRDTPIWFGRTCWLHHNVLLLPFLPCLNFLLHQLNVFVLRQINLLHVFVLRQVDELHVFVLRWIGLLLRSSLSLPIHTRNLVHRVRYFSRFGDRFVRLGSNLLRGPPID